MMAVMLGLVPMTAVMLGLVPMTASGRGQPGYDH
jgi:hypothetical protein